MESPLPYDDQDDEIKSQYDLIVSAIKSINSNSSEDDIRALNERIQREVTDKPILARITQDLNKDLILSVACDNGLSRTTIKCLIKANPSALLWVWETDAGTRTIHEIAGHSTHCALMTWIATDYQWVLDNEGCLESPPVFALLAQYADRTEETGCTAEIIRQFFEAYPRGLTQVDEHGDTPLHEILLGSVECEVDLFKWMAGRCPNSMLKQGSGWTPLVYACWALQRHHVGDDSSEICKYLIEQYPESVRVLDNYEWLPIHELLEHCQHQVVKEVVVLLLREYPESYDMAAPTDGDHVPAPSSVPFIQRINPLLDEERELKENVAHLQEIAGVFQDAVEGAKTTSSLASSTCDVFVNWATVSFVQRLEARMEQILTELQHECNAD